MKQCHHIQIEDDDVLEGNERFYVTLEGIAGVDRDQIALDPVNGTIEIVSDEKRKYASLYVGMQT